jgi:hypothetical protein
MRRHTTDAAQTHPLAGIAALFFDPQPILRSVPDRPGNAAIALDSSLILPGS